MKKLGIYILFAMAGLLFLLSCQEKGDVKYFRHLRMYKIHDLDFAYPVEPKEYKKINCYRVEYDELGRIVSAVYLKDGKLGLDQYNRLSSVEIKYAQNREHWYYKNLEGESVFKNIEFEAYNFDSTGRLLSCTNFSERGEITEDSIGVARYAFVVDSLNNVLKSIRINITGDTILDANGNYILCYDYDIRNNNVEVANRNKYGRLMLNHKGVAIDSLKYDNYKNLIGFSFYDIFYERTIDKGFDASIITYDYDINGNLISVNLFDENRKLLFNDSLGYAYYLIDYDNKGNVIKITSYDLCKKPTIVREYFKFGYIKEEKIYTSYRHLEGFENDEYSYHISKYNAEGKILEGSFYNSDGTLYETHRAFAIVRFLYDASNRLLEKGFYSKDENLVEDKLSGIALVKYEYDKFGLKKSLKKYGSDGRLKNDNFGGAASYLAKRDDAGNLTEISFFGENGNLMIPTGQDWATEISYYDNKNRLIGVSYFGDDGELVMNLEKGFSFTKAEHDGKDYSGRVSYYDADSTLINCDVTGFAIYEYDENESGELIEERFFDADSNLISKSTR